MTDQRTFLAMVSSAAVEDYFKLHPELMSDDISRIKRYVQEALVNSMFPELKQFHFDFGDQLNQPVSLMRDEHVFFGILRGARKRWHADLARQLIRICDALCIKSVSQREELNLLAHSERISRQIHAIIRSDDLHLQKELFQPIVFESMAKIARLFSGMFDEDSIFFDAATGTSRIPEDDDVRKRILMLPPEHRDYWIIPVGLEPLAVGLDC